MDSLSRTVARQEREVVTEGHDPREPIHRCRVAFILPSFAGGGAERVALTLASALDVQRFAPCIVAFDERGPLLDEVRSEVAVLGLGRERLRTALLPLLRQLHLGKFTVAVSTLGYVNLALLASRPLLPGNCRIVVREANLPQVTIDHAPIPWLARQGYRRLYPSADKIICPSQEIMQALSSDMGVPPDLLTLLPNPVDGERIRRSAATRVPGEGVRFVAAGRLTYQKGWDRLIEAFASLPGSLAHLAILGDGPERDALGSQIAARGLSNRVSLLGYVKEPWPYYRGADAFLMTSRWEGMPNAALEALAAGTPVIATPESGGLAELAREAPPASVTIAAAGSNFLNAISRVEPRVDLSDRASLLPRQYELAAAARRFSQILSSR